MQLPAWVKPRYLTEGLTKGTYAQKFCLVRKFTPFATFLYLH